MYKVGDKVIIDPRGNFTGLTDYSGMEGEVVRDHGHQRYNVRLASGQVKFFAEPELTTPEEAAKLPKFLVTVTNLADGTETFQKVVPEGTVEDMLDSMGWD